MDLSKHYKEIKKGRERILGKWRKKYNCDFNTKADRDLATDLAILNLKK